MFIPTRPILSAVGGLLGIGLYAQSVQAQAEPPTLEEIVVTARKRDETFQNVPITMDAFTAQQIHAAGIESPRDFVAMVPNMTMVEVQNVGNSFITIRGISQARNSEPSVAVLVDGVLETNPYEFNQELNDIQQIEVLKGPQGALYGRNAIGGAIIIHTVDPSDHFEGTAKVGIGNGISEKAQVAVSGPIDSAGTLRYRASLNFYNTDGFLQNTYLDRKADPYRDYSGRLRLLWKPADEWSADLRVFRDRVDTTAYYYIIPRRQRGERLQHFHDAAERERRHQSDPEQQPGHDNRDVLDTALKLDYNPGFGTFTSIIGLQPHQGNRHRGCLRFPADQQLPSRITSSSRAFRPPWAARSMRVRASSSTMKTWSQELRFTSNPRSAASRGSRARTTSTPNASSPPAISWTGATGVPRVYQHPMVDPTNPFATNTNVTFLSDSQNNNAWAVFADATYEIQSAVGVRCGDPLR